MACPKHTNPNHPKTGSSTVTEPIRDPRHIKAIKEYLHDNPKKLLLFTLGINTAWRVKDLLDTRLGEIYHLSHVDREWPKKESKTGKRRTVTANNGVLAIVDENLRNHTFEGLTNDSLIFTSLRGPIQPETVTAWLKEWTQAVGLQGRFGGRSLRQTWVYHQITNGTPLPVLMKMLGHSSELMTLRYACIQPTEFSTAYQSTEL